MGTMVRKIVWTILVILLCSTDVFAQSSAYTYHINKFEEGLAQGRQNLLFHLESAHLSDPQAEYPFTALTQIKSTDIYHSVYEGYLRSALSALQEKNYRTARFYFTAINHFEPDHPEAWHYLEQIDQVFKGDIEDVVIKPTALAQTTEPLPQNPRPTRTVQKLVYESEPLLLHVPVGEDKEEEEKALEEIYAPANKQVVYLKERPTSEKSTVEYTLSDKQIESQFEPVIDMDQALWAKQPNTELEVEVGQSIILKGSAVKRHLITADGYIDVERIDSNDLRISSLKRGATFLHIWDEQGRWTFNVRGITPARRVLKKATDVTVVREKYFDNFKLSQNTNWNSFYSGSSSDNLDRQSLIFRNWIGIYGETPYGEIDAGMTFNKFAESTERIEQTVGLTDGKIGPFKDFNVRIWDSARRFSDLTIPGRNFRGFSFDKYELNRDFRWAYIRGKDRSSASAVTPDSTDFRDSYIEGVRLTLYPENPDKNYSFNFARGWGEAREPGLKDRVYSVETNQRAGEWKLYGELAYDEDAEAMNVSAKRLRDDEKLRVFFRNIDEDFRTATGRPGNDGEIGALVRYDNRLSEDWDITTDIDLYQDRDQKNVDNEHLVNFDMSVSSDYNIDEKTKLRSSMYVVNTPQLTSPANNFRLNNTLSRTFEIWQNKRLTGFVGHTFQTNRYNLNAASEFNRHSLRAGIRMPIMRNMNYYLTHEQSWVDERFVNEHTTPSLTETGLSYNKYFGKKLSGNVSVHYRNEQETEGTFSFLSGADDVRTTFGLSYRPNNDMEVFLDGTYRNVWTEANDQDAITEMDVRLGVRTTWDMMFALNPSGIIGGIVWNDLNNNGLYDLGEPGVPNVSVRVGKQTITTNENGFYAVKIQAKSAIVDVDLESLPKGFLVTTGTLEEIEVNHHGDAILDFGLVSQTSMHGLIFVDDNGNGVFDVGERLISDVKIALDNVNEFSAYNGEYRFVGVEPGMHDVAVDISTIPMEYLPQVKLKDTVFIEEGEGLEYHIPLKEK